VSGQFERPQAPQQGPAKSARAASVRFSSLGQGTDNGNRITRASGVTAGTLTAGTTPPCLTPLQRGPSPTLSKRVRRAVRSSGESFRSASASSWIVRAHQSRFREEAKPRSPVHPSEKEDAHCQQDRQSHQPGVVCDGGTVGSTHFQRLPSTVMRRSWLSPQLVADRVPHPVPWTLVRRETPDPQVTYRNGRLKASRHTTILGYSSSALGPRLLRFRSRQAAGDFVDVSTTFIRRHSAAHVRIPPPSPRRVVRPTS